MIIIAAGVALAYLLPGLFITAIFIGMLGIAITSWKFWAALGVISLVIKLRRRQIKDRADTRREQIHAEQRASAQAKFDAAQPPVNVQLILADGSTFPADCIYTGLSHGDHYWKVLVPERFQGQVVRLSADSLPPRTQIVGTVYV